MASSLSQIRVLCSILTVSSFSLEIERIYRPQKSLGFYSSGWRNSGWLPGFSFAQINPGRSNHFFGLFFSLLVEFHRDWGIEWRGILCPTHPVLLQPPTTHFACILRRFWHTHTCMFAYILLRNKILLFLKWWQKPTCPILRYSSVLNMEKGNFTNFENSYKINKNSYNDNFLAVVIRKKWNLYFAKNLGG